MKNKVEYKEMEISVLKKSEYNPRQINESQYSQLKESLSKYGMTETICINSNPERENVIIGGHQRLEAWRDLGHDKIPCMLIDLNLDQEKELNIRLNKSGG